MALETVKHQTNVKLSHTELESSACLLSKWNKVNRLLLPYKTNSVFSVIFSG